MSHIAEDNTVQTRQLKDRIWKLKFIPLQDGKWASPADSVYYPRIDEQEIPADLMLNLLHPQALGTGSQKALYESLGVSQCPPQMVFTRIMDVQFERSPRSGDIPTAVLHWRFLHWFGKDISLHDRKQLFAYSANRNKRDVKEGLYFPSSDAYAAQSLLKVIEEARLPGKGIQTDLILNKYFLPENNPQTFHHGRTWKQWLEEIAIIRRYPPLLNVTSLFGGNCLSPILQKILEADSGVFLHTLCNHWPREYSHEYQSNRMLLNQIFQGVKVKCVNGETLGIAQTFFPTKELRENAEDLGVKESMPFVKLKEASPNELEWSFLKNFDVKFDVSLEFWLRSLTALRRVEGLSPTGMQASAKKIYEKIGHIANQETLESIKVSR